MTELQKRPLNFSICTSGSAAATAAQQQLASTAAVLQAAGYLRGPPPFVAERGAAVLPAQVRSHKTEHHTDNEPMPAIDRCNALSDRHVTM